MRLTILFDDPYWVGLLEDERDGCLYAARHIFGAEPNDTQVYEFVLHDSAALFARMTIGVPVASAERRQVGYKRMIRETRRAVEERGISTLAQEAIKQQYAQNKQARHSATRAERDAGAERKRAIARQKAKDKHRGR